MNNNVNKEPFLILDNLGSLHSMNSTVNKNKISLYHIHKLFFKKFKKIKYIELDNNIIMVYGKNSINEPWEFNSIASFISNIDIFSSIVIFISKYNIKSFNKKISLKNNNYTFNDLYNNVIDILNKANTQYLDSIKNNNINENNNELESTESNELPCNNAILHINNTKSLLLENDFINDYIIPNKFMSYEKINDGVLLKRNGLIGIIYDSESNTNPILYLYFIQNYKNNNLIS